MLGDAPFDPQPPAPTEFGVLVGGRWSGTVAVVTLEALVVGFTAEHAAALSAGPGSILELTAGDCVVSVYLSGKGENTLALRKRLAPTGFMQEWKQRWQQLELRRMDAALARGDKAKAEQNKANAFEDEMLAWAAKQLATTPSVGYFIAHWDDDNVQVLQVVDLVGRSRDWGCKVGDTTQVCKAATP